MPHPFYVDIHRTVPVVSRNLIKGLKGEPLIKGRVVYQDIKLPKVIYDPLYSLLNGGPIRDIDLEANWGAP